MPPINQQGSRAGLVTALVVFVILFVVSAVFAFNYYAQVKQLTLNSEAYKKQYNGYLSDAAIQSPQVQALVAAKTEQPPRFGVVNSPAETAIDVAMKQTAGLGAILTGANADQPAAATADTATTELKTDSDALKAANVPLNLNPLGMIAAVKQLTTAAVDRQHQIDSLQRELALANDQVTKLTASVAEVNSNKDQQAKAAADAAKADLDKATASSADTTKTLQQVQQEEADNVKKFQDTQQQALNQVTDAQTQLKAQQQKAQTLEDRLGNRRMDVTNAAVRQADGRLIRVVPSSNVCYINLGYGTGVTNGLTFEVYDKLSGVPPIPPNVTGDEQLPVGKASIEIIHVGDNSSECRIVHAEPGAVLTEGDPIENLVYDAHQRYRFDVYGNFDLANTGRPNPADAEVIKRLVTQWGGKLTDQVNTDTDFLVLGAEPVLPEFSKDDLTPENQDKLQKAQDALDKYQEVRQLAVQYHIPILNQNRFLYYVGYYDQAKR